jgi:hypothetical protein
MVVTIVNYCLVRCDTFMAYVASKTRRKAFELTGDSFDVMVNRTKKIVSILLPRYE